MFQETSVLTSLVETLSKDNQSFQKIIVPETCHNFPAGIYLLKINNRNTQGVKYVQSRSGIFIVNFEHISYLVLVFLLLTWNM